MYNIKTKKNICIYSISKKKFIRSDGWKTGTAETQISANTNDVLRMFKQHQQEHILQPKDDIIQHIIDRTTDTNVIPHVYEGNHSTTYYRNDGHEQKPLLFDIEMNEQNTEDALLEDFVTKINKLSVGANAVLEKSSSSILTNILSVNDGNGTASNCSTVAAINEDISNQFEQQDDSVLEPEESYIDNLGRVSSTNVQRPIQ